MSNVILHHAHWSWSSGSSGHLGSMFTILEAGSKNCLCHATYTGIEHDIHGRQEIAYKVMQHLNSEEEDTTKINTISTEKWIRHFKQLWHDRAEVEQVNKNTTDIYNTI